MSKHAPKPCPPRVPLVARQLPPKVRTRVDALLDRLLDHTWPPVIWPA